MNNNLVEITVIVELFFTFFEKILNSITIKYFTKIIKLVKEFSLQKI